MIEAVEKFMWKISITTSTKYIMDSNPVERIKFCIHMKSALDYLPQRLRYGD